MLHDAQLNATVTLERWPTAGAEAMIAHVWKLSVNHFRSSIVAAVVQNMDFNGNRLS